MPSFDPESDLQDDLPPTPFELEERRHAVIRDQNERRARRDLRARNQKKGHDEPRPGTSLFIQLDGSLYRRGRAGLRFEKGQRSEVKILDKSDEEIREMQRSGAMVVNPYGAELLLDDSALHVFPQALTDIELEDLKASHAQVEEELRLSREENARLRSEVRAARMAAEPSTDGRPTRLPAAAKAAAAAAASNAAAGDPKAKAPAKETAEAGETGK
jgi:hypothetical protein